MFSIKILLKIRKYNLYQTGMWNIYDLILNSYLFQSFFKSCIYLKGRVVELQDREKDRGVRSSICWSIPQMATTADAGLVQSQEPGTSSFFMVL